ncbi:MAG TPA: penicillin acylase family protein [Thermoanaerobaculaceae bacterium]|nr:penicillin acylase family protein [Thermoanaerobaculaceae bacterium]HRS16244.1 penicillin acylase family protein [Thermoanaerobaculaceae bacterium]
MSDRDGTPTAFTASGRTAAAVPRPTGRLARTAFTAWTFVVLVAAVAGVWVWARLCASLPLLRGEHGLPGLEHAVTVERDALGVPVIRAASRLDAIRALGFLHAQDRLFQMDLLRRASAGELSALLGPSALETDRKVRVHRLRETAERSVAQAPPADRAAVAAYRDGVNAGRAALGDLPWEYLILRQRPRPWQDTDSVLVLLSMFLTLQESDGAAETRQGLLRDLLPASLLRFLGPGGTEWDAALDGSTMPVPPIPGPEVLDLRARPVAVRTARRVLAEEDPDLLPGSNNWAVAAGRSRHGGAMVANDMHLGLDVPAIWYRAVLEWPDRTAPGGRRRLAGVTLPGTPALVAGSNGQVAWGFTNAQIDTSDVIVLEPAPDDPSGYLAPDGPRRLQTFVETVEVRGAAPVEVRIERSLWGPVVGTDHRGRRLALSWVAHHPEAVSLGLLAVALASSLEEALDRANRAGIPAQNFVCADSHGRIGWTVAGRLPRRVGFDGRYPESWADGTRRWEGWLEPEEVPRILDPDGGTLWTANNRVVGGPALAVLGDGGYDLGARAGQIRDRLGALEAASECDLLAVQLDDRAHFLERWHRLALATLTPPACAASPTRADLRRVLATTWSGHASVDSAAYRLVRELRAEVARRALQPLVAACVGAEHDVPVLRLPQVEGPLWRLLTERPRHLLAPEYGDWNTLVLASLDTVAARAIETSGSLAAHTWGRRNTVRARHPLSRALGPLAALLDLPARQLPGDSHMPRVQSPSFGASERFVVSPGREQSGVFHMPGGPSGHPLSPFYRAGFDAWANGEPAPFLPGPPVTTLVLVPERPAAGPGGG